MINLTVPFDIPLNQLSVQLLPYVDWSNVTVTDILSLPASSMKYVSTKQLINVYTNNNIINMSDEDILSVIARDIKIMVAKYDYIKDSRLEGFLYTFCSFEFLMKYHQQIYAMCMLNNTATRVQALMLTYGLQPLSKLVDFGLYEVRWDVLNRREVPIQHRFTILRSGSYMGYTIVYDKEIEEMAPVLYSEQLGSMSFIPHVPHIFDATAIDYIFQCNTNMFPGIADRTTITWNELIDLYLDEKIHYSQICTSWEFFLRNCDITVDEFSEKISSKFGNRSTFSAEDFL